MNIIESMKSQLTGENVSKAAAHLGESESSTAKAINGLFPMVWGAIFAKAHTHEGAASMLSTARNIHKSGMAKDMGELFAGKAGHLGKGAELAKDLLGSKSGSISRSVTSYSGIKSSSVSSLIAMVAPALTAILGKFALETDLDAAGLMAMAKSNSETVVGLLPAGLSGFAGHSSHGTHGDSASHGGHGSASSTADGANDGSKSLMPVFLGVAASFLLIALLLMYRPGKAQPKVVETPPAPVIVEQPVPEPVVVPEVVTGHLDEQSGNFIYESGAATELKLPNGALINAGANSSEASLFNMLNDAAWMVSDDKTQGWVTLDRVYFQTGSSKLTAESQSQLQNLSSILTAFPSAEIKLGGYTDNKGDSTKNVSLSQKRAEVAMKELVKLSVTGNRLKAEGYGPMHPIATNATPEGNAQNRRVDIRVTKK